jgi:hypothetical protein
MERLGSLETSSDNYHYTLHNIPEERRFPLFGAGSLKPRNCTHHLVGNCLMPRKSQEVNTAMKVRGRVQEGERTSNSYDLSF